MGDFNTTASSIDTLNKQKLTKEILELNNIKNQIDLIDIYKIKVYTLFSAGHGASFKLTTYFDTKQFLNRYKEIEITSCNLSDHYRLKQ